MVDIYPNVDIINAKKKGNNTENDPKNDPFPAGLNLT